MQFVTRDPKTLPERARFGREPSYTKEEVMEAARTLRKGNAISNGETYPDRAKAHNAAGTLRMRLVKAVPDIKTSSTAIKTSADGEPEAWQWWLAPVTTPKAQTSPKRTS
jgi:hypothetical protein